MQTCTALLVRRARSRNCKFRRAVHRICNRIKHSRVNLRMSAMNSINSSAQLCDVISLLDDDDDDNITNENAFEGFCGTHKDVQCVPRKDKKHLSKYGWGNTPRVTEQLVATIVDLGNDQEQASGTLRRTRILKRKHNSVPLCVGDANCKKMVDMPATVVSENEDEVKVLGAGTQVTSLAENDANEVELLQQEDDIVIVLENSCPQKTGEAKPTSCLKSEQDKPASPDHSKNVQKKQESNHSIIISDSDDTDEDNASTGVAHPKSDQKYIPLAQKQLDTSIEILENVHRLQQSPDLLVVKHIPPPTQTSTNQGSGVVTMFEDRAGNFEQFFNGNAWKKLKNQNTGWQLQKLNTGCAANAAAEPVKPRDDSNIYNPSPVLDKCGLRPVIIDGNNVAWGHGNHQYFSATGLEICINYFAQRRHRVIAFVPQHCKTRKVPGFMEILEKYEKLGQIVMTPSRKIDGKTVSSYDDRYIVQAATELGGVIVSTDNFRDIMAESQRWKETIEKRLLMFTWVGDMLMFPQDPLGRDGPSLDEFLRFPN